MIAVESFKKILKCSQFELKKVVKLLLKEKKYSPVVGDGFVYATGDIPILLVAHLDTVHKSLPEEIYYDSEKDVMWCPEGIGGDDRCGVYAILKLIEEYKPYVLFTEDEEKGCKGAKKMVDLILEPSVKFIVEIDRRGKDDCVFYDCDNINFHKYIEGFGFKTAIGSYSDICVLSDAWEIASVNLSSGYYNEHTSSEIIKLMELEDTYNKVKKILENDKTNKEYFTYDKKQYILPALPKKTPKKSYYNEKCEYSDEFGYVDENGKFHYWSDEY